MIGPSTPPVINDAAFDAAQTRKRERRLKQQTNSKNGTLRSSRSSKSTSSKEARAASSKAGSRASTRPQLKPASGSTRPQQKPATGSRSRGSSRYLSVSRGQGTGDVEVANEDGRGERDGDTIEMPSQCIVLAKDNQTSAQIAAEVALH